jgi:hypothetical protein
VSLEGNAPESEATTSTTPPISLTARRALRAKEAAAAPEKPNPWRTPEDRSEAALSPDGGREIVDDLIKAGRIHLVAAEEGTGKTFAIQGELGIRLAIAGGKWAETFAITETGPVLVISEMHSDEDFLRESMILESLGLARGSLAGRYFRQNLDDPILDNPEWIASMTAWANETDAIALIVDTATMATDIDPWGPDFRTVMRALQAASRECPKLAIILVVHLKKPQGGRGDAKRHLSDVMGEWGRYNDITILLQGDGADHIRVSTHKRVRTPRHLRLRKVNGLLVEPQDLNGKQEPKVSGEGTLAAITDNPGLNLHQLAAAIGVTRPTAKNYVDRLIANGQARTEDGPNHATLVFPATPGDTGDQYSWVDDLDAEASA